MWVAGVLSVASLCDSVRHGQSALMSDDLGQHESGLRKMVSETRGERYEALSGLSEAKQHEDVYAVFEGDDGGQVYAVFLATSVHCDQPTLERLLADLDSIAWPGNAPDSARVFYERHSPGGGVVGGMGGGVARVDGWIHREFENLGIADQIRAVVSGTLDRVRPPQRPDIVAGPDQHGHRPVTPNEAFARSVG